ncbi:MAG: amidohydrolase family protein [Christensenellales bacterium]|jgi:predicted TIM-barrel fold metal-dependent hydrolase
MIIDAHTHIFPVINGYGPKGRTLSLTYGRVDQGDGIPEQVMPPLCEVTKHTGEMLLESMDWAGVDRAVLLQCPCYGDWSDYVLKICNMYPHRFIASAFFDPWSDHARDYYDSRIRPFQWRIVKLECSESSGLCGVYSGIKLYDDIRWVYDALESEDRIVVFDLGQPGTTSYQTEQIERLSIEHPSLKIVICHMGQLSYKVKTDKILMQEWYKQLKLGLRDNIWFDYSALPFHVPQEEYPFPSATRYLKLAVDIIGAEKLMWGTDVPWLLGYATYKQFVQLAKNQVEDLSTKQQEMLLGKTAYRLYWGGKE